MSFYLNNFLCYYKLMEDIYEIISYIIEELIYIIHNVENNDTPFQWKKRIYDTFDNKNSTFTNKNVTFTIYELLQNPECILFINKQLQSIFMKVHFSYETEMISKNKFKLYINIDANTLEE